MSLVNWWPALPFAWHGRNAIALSLAVGYAWLLCFALLTLGLWPDWISPAVQFFLWAAVLMVWLVGILINWFFFQPFQGQAGDDDSFRLARQNYLCGNWEAAEHQTRRVLAAAPRDAEALLLMASVYRRTDRVSLARQVLEDLQLLDSGARWAFEVEREQRLLKSSSTKTASDDQHIDDGSNQVKA